jgi:hypothetical protein
VISTALHYCAGGALPPVLPNLCVAQPLRCVRLVSTSGMRAGSGRRVRSGARSLACAGTLWASAQPSFRCRLGPTCAAAACAAGAAASLAEHTRAAHAAPPRGHLRRGSRTSAAPLPPRAGRRGHHTAPAAKRAAQRTAGARIALLWRAAALPLCSRAALSTQRAPTRRFRRTSRRIRRIPSTRRSRLRRQSGVLLCRTALASPWGGRSRACACSQRRGRSSDPRHAGGRGGHHDVHYQLADGHRPAGAMQ